MYKTIKYLLSLALLALVTACGGGGGPTSYQIVFSGTVAGLPSGQQLTLLGTLPTTGQSVSITIAKNGAFGSQIILPSGYNLTNYGAANVIISQQPTAAKCSVSFTTNSAITVNCATIVGAAGLYLGSFTSPTLSTGIGQMFIQNNGNYWLMFGNSTTSGTAYSAIVSGTGLSTTTTFTSNNGVDIFSSPQFVNTVISATYQSLSTFIGSISKSTTSWELNLSAVPYYSFNGTPLLSALAGTYDVSLITRHSTDAIAISIGANGSFSGITANGCAITGGATPMTSGENAYDLSINFGPSPCVNPSTTQTGTVLLITTTAGTQLVGGIFSTGMTDGTMLVSTKQ